MSEVVVETPAPAATEAPAVEAPPAPPTPEKAPDKPRPGEFAKKAAAERARVAAAAADKGAKEEAEKARAEARSLQEKLETLEKRRAGYVKNPLQALLDAFPGMEPVRAFEMIAEAAKNHGKPPVQAETYELQQRLDRVEAQRQADLEAQKSEREKAVREQAQAAEKAFRSEVSDFVKENAGEYELTALYDQHAAVYAVIEAEYAKTGKILPTKEAAAKVEAKLEELVEKSLAAKKVAAKIAAKAKPAEDPAPRTLSNDLATQVTTERSPAATEAERMARAAKALEKFGI